MRILVVCLAALSALFFQELPDKGPKPPVVGEAAPAFRLNGHDGRGVSVGGESETWTVVAFFPKAATPG